jgi:hypothetical protein
MLKLRWRDRFGEPLREASCSLGPPRRATSHDPNDRRADRRPPGNAQVALRYQIQ